jgi:hypothetical protein
MRLLRTIGLAAGLAGLFAAPAKAQQPEARGIYEGPYSVYGAPGWYGTAWGSASYGSVRTYSSFSSPWGAGYGSRFGPSSFARNAWGTGIWRPGWSDSPYEPGNSGYWTWPIGSNTPGLTATAKPGIGWYAPAFGAPNGPAHQW